MGHAGGEALRYTRIHDPQHPRIPVFLEFLRHEQPLLQVVRHDVVNQLGLLEDVVGVGEIEHLEHDDSQRKDITFGGEEFGLIAEDLRRTIGDGESRLVSLIKEVITLGADLGVVGLAEVNEFDEQVVVEHDVAGLEVQMDDVLVPEEPQRLHDRVEQDELCPQAHRLPVTPHVAREGIEGDIVHQQGSTVRIGLIHDVVVLGQEDGWLPDGPDDFELMAVSTETAVIVLPLDDHPLEQDVLVGGEVALVEPQRIVAGGGLHTDILDVGHEDTTETALVDHPQLQSRQVVHVDVVQDQQVFSCTLGLRLDRDGDAGFGGSLIILCEIKAIFGKVVVFKGGAKGEERTEPVEPFLYGDGVFIHSLDLQLPLAIRMGNLLFGNGVGLRDEHPHVRQTQTLKGRVQSTGVVGVFGFKLPTAFCNNHFQEGQGVLHIVFEDVLDHGAAPWYDGMEVGMRTGMEGEAKGKGAIGQVERGLKQAVFREIPHLRGELQQGSGVSGLKGDVLGGQKMELDADLLRKFVELDAHKVFVVRHHAPHHHHQLLAFMVLEYRLRCAFSQFPDFRLEVYLLFLRLLREGIFAGVGKGMGTLFHEHAVELGIREEEQAHEVYFRDEVQILQFHNRIAEAQIGWQFAILDCTLEFTLFWKGTRLCLYLEREAFQFIWKDGAEGFCFGWWQQDRRAAIKRKHLLLIQQDIIFIRLFFPNYQNRQILPRYS